MIPRIEPVLGLQSRLPDRPKDGQERESQRREKETFDKALQDAKEVEDGRKDRGGT